LNSFKIDIFMKVRSRFTWGWNN